MAATRRSLSLSPRFGLRCMLRLVPLGAMMLLVAACSAVQASHPSGAATTAQPTVARTSVPPAQAPASATVVTQAAEPTIAPTEMPPAPDPGAIEAALSTLDTVPAAAPTAEPGWTNQTAAGAWGASTEPTPAAAPAVTVRPGPKYWGVATYYGADFQGQPMAAGPAFDMRDPSVTASNSWPLGTRLRITRIPGGPWDSLLTPAERQIYFSRSIVVTVMDRGAFTHALDLSWGAFAELGNPAEGVIRVLIEPVDGVPPVKGLRGAAAGPDL